MRHRSGRLPSMPPARARPPLAGARACVDMPVEQADWCARLRDRAPLRARLSRPLRVLGSLQAAPSASSRSPLLQLLGAGAGPSPALSRVAASATRLTVSFTMRRRYSSRNVLCGLRPYVWRYCTANRPVCVNPQLAAIAVTVSWLGRRPQVLVRHGAAGPAAGTAVGVVSRWRRNMYCTARGVTWMASAMSAIAMSLAAFDSMYSMARRSKRRPVVVAIVRNGCRPSPCWRRSTMSPRPAAGGVSEHQRCRHASSASTLSLT